jgi:hypothetical protein
MRNDVIYFLVEGEICQGWIHVNDPFLQQMEVWHRESPTMPAEPDKTSPPVFVSYRDIRPKPEPNADTKPSYTPDSSCESIIDSPVPCAQPPPCKRRITIDGSPIADAMNACIATCTGMSYICPSNFVRITFQIHKFCHHNHD